MSTPSNTAIPEVLSQNVEAVEKIKSASNELQVVHAVLSTQVPSAQTNPDVLAAVERTDEIGQQLAETAEALEKSNEMLREIEASSNRESA
ncbi:MAG: hypothetical protein EON54_28605 [Alcaligenaceae bacterium]|nr:MAG: hypothetical protein EON54_28605 [Alcaligenaceae bacterium]